MLEEEKAAPLEWPSCVIKEEEENGVTAEGLAGEEGARSWMTVKEGDLEVSPGRSLCGRSLMLQN